jgi:hypothetical protein
MKDPRAELVAKAVKDPKFREELKRNPAAVIEKSAGVKLPAGLTVKVLEDTAGVVHLVLPPDAGALSEADLKKVAGGADAATYGNLCAASTGQFSYPCTPAGQMRPDGTTA